MSTKAATSAAGSRVGTLGILLSFEDRQREALPFLREAATVLERAIGPDKLYTKQWEV